MSYSHCLFYVVFHRLRFDRRSFNHIILFHSLLLQWYDGFPTQELVTLIPNDRTAVMDGKKHSFALSYAVSIRIQ